MKNKNSPSELISTHCKKYVYLCSRRITGNWCLKGLFNEMNLFEMKVNAFHVQKNNFIHIVFDFQTLQKVYSNWVPRCGATRKARRRSSYVKTLRFSSNWGHKKRWNSGDFLPFCGKNLWFEPFDLAKFLQRKNISLRLLIQFRH